jgi:uncharacterized membrane protein (UPF0127 family)
LPAEAICDDGRVQRYPLGSERLLTHTRRAALTLLALGIFGFLIVGANSPANPILVPPQGLVKDPAFRGFGAVDISVVRGARLEASGWPRCALLASTPAQQARGLMGQRSLDGFVGMVFAFGRPVTARFYMKGTPLALAIAWFDPSGRFVGSAQMPPCPERVTNCPTYGPRSAFQWALEVPAGGAGLRALGIGPGSSLQVGTPCIG